MNALLTRLANSDPRAFVAAGIAAGAALADAWHFRAFGMNLDVALLSVALGALGAHIAGN